MNEKDYFYYEYLYPEADKLFSSSYKSLNEIKDKAIYVFDTSAILVPYDTTEKGFDEISKILFGLKEANKIFIPERVAREFANNRPTKIGNVFLKLRQLKQNFNSGNFNVENFPLLETNEEFTFIKDEADKIKKSINVLRDKISKLEEVILSWTWNDPVSVEYSKIFTSDIIIDIKMSKSDLIEDLKWRVKHGISPGFKDVNKSDEGIGDLIIWKTIIEISREKECDIIFVTNDSKNDWFIKQEKQKLFPKYELFEEFRRETKGKNFAIIDFLKFLDLQHAPKDIINEVKDSIETVIDNKLIRNQIYENNRELMDRLNFKNDYHPYSDTKNLEEGRIVYHEKFGFGEVLKIYEGSDRKAEIMFERYGLKTLILSFAKLKVLKNG